MKLIIAGGRNFTDYQKLKEACDQFLKNQNNIEIVSGAYYKGADNLAIKYAKENGYELTKFPANWNKYGKAAGPIRNKQMAEYTEELIAFWDGKSRGTKNMLQLVNSRNLDILICYH